jgi:hypothetical protein
MGVLPERSALEAERLLCRLAAGSPRREALEEVMRGAESAAFRSYTACRLA